MKHAIYYARLRSVLYCAFSAARSFHCRRQDSSPRVLAKSVPVDCLSPSPFLFCCPGAKLFRGTYRMASKRQSPPERQESDPSVPK